VAAKALLSPRGASAVASEPAAATATAAAAATAAPSTRSTDERLQALEASNTALLALTARLEERIAQLEQQLASK
jgi:3-oxoacyl-ACP reductase-like protein